MDAIETLGEALSLQSHDNSVVQKIRDIQAEARALGEFCNKKIFRLEQEMVEYSDYHQALQDTEKWLLQMSFQLMAHNSLYVSSKELVEELLEQHKVEICHNFRRFKADQ